MNLPRRILLGEGAIGRSTFLLAGLSLAFLKQLLDIALAVLVFHRGYTFFNYWLPMGAVVALRSLSPGDLKGLLLLVLQAGPFIWIGVCLTLARLRDAGLPGWAVLFFFLPFLNALFFVCLCCVPSSAERREPLRPGGAGRGRMEDWIPRGALASAFAGAFLALLLGLLFALFATEFLVSYGWSLFVGIPFTMGFLSVMVYGYREPRSLITCLGVACLSPLLLGLALLAFAIEGVVCLIMAAPLAIGLSAMGGLLAWSVQRRRWNASAAPAMMGALVLALPLGMLVEHSAAPNPPVFAVTSSVEVDAPPEVVWPNVIAFAELPPPRELLFRAGIAYPIRAEIAGSGPGAVRHCVFSTGAFVEPIQVWDAPRLLKFSVVSNPAPLAEWTPYNHVTPPHLRGFLVSQGGQFRLVPLPGGRTRLEGTTWYRHSMWPAAYWKLWSDHIIHEIHIRVLRYIAARSESPRRMDTRSRSPGVSANGS